MFNLPYKKILLSIILLTFVVNFAMPGVAYAVSSVNAPAANGTGNGNPPTTGGCELTIFPETYFNNAVCLEDILAWVGSLALTITGLFIALGGIVLNFVMKFTVVDMQFNISHIDGINAVWKTFRDLSNMLLIFILLYIAIGTILDLGSVNMKKTLRNVILVAVLLNFSLFFTKVLIDASNIVSLGFYNNIAISSAGAQSQTVLGQQIDIGLSGVFMQKMGLSSLWDPSGANKALADTHSSMKIFMIGFFGSMFFIVGGFIFLAGAVMFTYRYIMFIFLMMFSPLAFVSMALPSDKYSSKFWQPLIKQCLVAPIFMAIIWATLTSLNSILSGSTNGESFSLAFSNLSKGQGLTAVASLFMNFIIVIGMFVFALFASQELGGAGAKWGLGKVDKLRKGTQGVLGRSAVRMSGANFVDKKVFGGSFGKTYVGSQLRNITTGVPVKAEFGSGKSVEKINKDEKKRTEDYAKEIEKSLDKTFDKSLKERRTTEINRIDARMAAGLATNEERDRRKDLFERRRDELEASAWEKREWLRPEQRAEADRLSSRKYWAHPLFVSASRKAAAKKLRENAKRGGAKSTDDLLSSLGASAGGGGGGAAPAGGGGGGAAPAGGAGTP